VKEFIFICVETKRGKILLAENEAMLVFFFEREKERENIT
jgi:hypothetical protein